jgi:hypothetical protein
MLRMRLASAKARRLHKYAAELEAQVAADGNEGTGGAA